MEGLHDFGILYYGDFEPRNMAQTFLSFNIFVVVRSEPCLSKCRHYEE